MEGRRRRRSRDSFNNYVYQEAEVAMLPPIRKSSFSVTSRVLSLVEMYLGTRENLYAMVRTSKRFSAEFALYTFLGFMRVTV